MDIEFYGECALEVSVVVDGQRGSGSTGEWGHRVTRGGGWAGGPESAAERRMTEGLITVQTPPTPRIRNERVRAWVVV